MSLARVGFEIVHLAPGSGENCRKKNVLVQTYKPQSGFMGRIAQLFKLYRLAADIDADCYHCNEVDSWILGVLLKLFKGKVCIFDVHEHYPSRFVGRRNIPVPIGLAVGGCIYLLYWILTPLTDYIVLAKNSVAIDFKRHKEKLILVRNFSPLIFLKNKPNNHTRISPNKETLQMIHLGLINKDRGWPQILRSMTSVQKLNLLIVGRFDDGSRSEFENEVRRLGLERRVKIEDWMPFQEALERILCSDIGLVMFQPGKLNYIYAMPHKMFDYMLAGIAVVVPNFAEEIADIVDESKCGILIDTSIPEQLAIALNRLKDSGVRERMGENGRKAVIEKYNWEGEALKLIAMYQDIQRIKNAREPELFEHG
ncbi:glycosyltransferase [Pseudomonadota bacterium]